MREPQSPAEVRCLLLKMVAEDAFKIHDVDADIVIQIDHTLLSEAVEEFVRAIEGAYVGESTPTACERLIGLLFVNAISAAVTDCENKSHLVTIEEA